MLGLGISQAVRSSGGGGNVPAPSWPLTASNVMRIHPGMTWAGTASDVQSITFDNGLTMIAAGIGAPITKDATGFHFWMGKYLSYMPAQITAFSALSAFAKVSMKAIPPEGAGGLTQTSAGSAQQRPITVVGSGENLLYFRRRQTDITCDVGARTIRAGWLSPDIGSHTTDKTFTIGAYVDADPNHAERSGAMSIWLSGAIKVAGEQAETLAPTEWQVGKSTYGTLHEGVVFTRPVGVDAPLYPDGVDSRWVYDQLSA